MRWWHGQYVPAQSDGSECETPATMGSEFVNYTIRAALDSYIRVTMVGKCVLIDNSESCSSYSQTYTFNCVSITENGADDWTIRWELEAYEQTSWIEFDTATSGDIDSWSFSFSIAHFPHYNPISEESYCASTTGCTCEIDACKAIPSGGINSSGAHPSISSNLYLYRLDDPFNDNDFCLGGDGCPEVPAFTTILAEVHNCDGTDVDPHDGVWGQGFRIDYSECCVEV